MIGQSVTIFFEQTLLLKVVLVVILLFFYVMHSTRMPNDIVLDIVVVVAALLYFDAEAKIEVCKFTLLHKIVCTHLFNYVYNHDDPCQSN